MRATACDMSQITSSRWGLTPGRAYQVLSVESGALRVVCDHSEPILFPVGYFDILDRTVPENWICDGDPWDDGYLGPPEFGVVGFFEDYFDHKPDAIALFRAVMDRDYGSSE